MMTILMALFMFNELRSEMKLESERNQLVAFKMSVVVLH